MTTSHVVLQNCPLRDALRKDIWPNGVNLQDQLYADRADMQMTAENIPTSGIDRREKVNAKKNMMIKRYHKKTFRSVLKVRRKSKMVEKNLPFDSKWMFYFQERRHPPVPCAKRDTSVI
jgi:hypothetical protein